MAACQIKRRSSVGKSEKIRNRLVSLEVIVVDNLFMNLFSFLGRG